MKCKEAKTLLSAGVDGELTPSEELALEKHVSTCAGCARDKADFVRLNGAMPLWADAEPSPWLAEKFAYKLAELQKAGTACAPQKRFRWGTLSAATAGFAAAILVIGLLIHGNMPSPQAPMQAKVRPSVKTSLPNTKSADNTVVATNPVTALTHVRTIAHHAKRTQVHYAAPAAHPHPDTNIAPAPPAPTPTDADAGASSVATSAVAALAKSAASENLGEASLAMNDTIERVRGNLQKSVDLMVSQPPVPVTESSDTNGGSQ